MDAHWVVGSALQGRVDQSPNCLEETGRERSYRNIYLQEAYPYCATHQAHASYSLPNCLFHGIHSNTLPQSQHVSLGLLSHERTTLTPPHESVQHRASPLTCYENQDYPRYRRGLLPTDGQYPLPQNPQTSQAERRFQAHQSRGQSDEQKDFYHSRWWCLDVEYHSYWLHQQRYRRSRWHILECYSWQNSRYLQSECHRSRHLNHRHSQRNQRYNPSFWGLHNTVQPRWELSEYDESSLSVNRYGSG